LYGGAGGAPPGYACAPRARLVPPDASIHFAPQRDRLGRLKAALDAFPADALVRVGIDHPFIDPTLIDRLVSSAESSHGCDYASFCLRDGRPVTRARLGLCAEWCRGSALVQANQNATHPQDRNDPMRYMLSHPERFTLRLLPVPAALDRDDLRLEIRQAEDWDHAQVIFEALPNDPLDWQAVAELVDRHPSLRERMAALNQTEGSDGRWD
jgi:spore coat polysaccharide biosynthesis protein SpsF